MSDTGAGLSLASDIGAKLEPAELAGAHQCLTSMPDLLLRRAAIADVYALALHLRPGDRAEIAAIGKEPRRVLRQSFRSSLYAPRCAMVDGEVAAMWGIGGDILSDIGAPWLMTGTVCDRVPVTFLRVAKAELAAMLAVKRRLENFVAADYSKAIRLLEVLGFTLEAPEPIGSKQAAFRRFWIEA